MYKLTLGGTLTLKVGYETTVEEFTQEDLKNLKTVYQSLLEEAIKRAARDTKIELVESNVKVEASEVKE